MKAKTNFSTLGCIALTLAVIVCSCKGKEEDLIDPTIKKDTTLTNKPIDKEEVFFFPSNGKTIGGKIFIPAGYETNKDLPAIYLIDFTEEHHKVATDEFYKVIEGVRGVKGLDALVVTLSELRDVALKHPGDYQEYSDLFKNLASYVDKNYTSNTSRTFIGRGSEASQVLMTLFLEEKETSVFQNFIVTDDLISGQIVHWINNGQFPQEKENKKLHYSFSNEPSYRDHHISFTKAITEKAYPWLKFKSVEYTSFTFEGAYPTAYADGIKFIFEE